ncbi:MAG TPA: type IV pilus secretin PilQ, partial [Kofleriaceae bacterium]
DMLRTQQEAERARADLAKAQVDAQAEATKAREDMLRTQAETQRARAEAAQKQLEITKAREEVARSRAAAQRVAEEIARTQLEATKAREETARTKADADKVRVEIAKKQAEANQARADMLRTQQEAERARADLAKAQTEAQAMVAKSRAEADQVKRDAAQAINAAQSEVQVARADAARARSEAETAKAQAEAARVAAAADKKQAELDKHKAETARKDAEKLVKEAKGQLATLEHKTLAAQQLDDKARAVLAAAQAREEAARETVAQLTRERETAEAAAKRAQEARDRSAAVDRGKLAADAKAAEERLAKARQATAEADARRLSAEQAATRARVDLEQTKTTLASVEQQRTSAVAAATEAARKRSEAEAAASDASRRRGEAEVAATEAAKKRREAEVAANEAAKRRGQAEIDRAHAEAQRVAAEQAAREAKLAQDAAEKQRKIAEAAAQQALAAKRDAETSVATLTMKRQAAEKAADELAARAKAEAKAQAEVVAAKSRQATEAEIAVARREVARLADERKRAEAELADRRKAVAQQQAESARLATTAAQAKDAADREETRRTQLAEQRAQEEQELARIKAQKVQAQVAQTPTRTPQPMPVAPAPVAAKPAPAPAPVAAKPAPVKLAKVQSVTFKGNADSGLVELAMAGDGNVQLGEISSSHVELIVDNAELAPKLERTLDVSKFGSPVKKVSSFRDRRTPNRVRLVAELASPAIPTVVRDATSVRWRFAANPVAQKPVQKVPPQVVGGFGAASTPVAQQSVAQVPPAGRGRRIYHGATVEFDFKDAPIHDLLRIIADTGGVNIVVPDTIDAKVTVRLKRVPWDQALEVILSSHGLWYRREGNLYRIAPRKELDAEDEAEAARRAAAAASEMPRPEIVRLNYASADELKPKLEGMLSPKGKIEVDGRTNALIISDIAATRAEIAKLAYELDTQTPQITIEARIVEARSTFVRQFGIQWGGRALAGAAGGNATGLVFPSSIGIRGGNDDSQTRSEGITALPPDFAINLPAATGTGEGGAIGLSLGSVGGNFNINLRLSALEDTGSVRIISAPKITVLNNKSALIRQGVSIPISVVSAAGTQTQFVQADLKLEVTPYVSQRDCAIAMNLDVTKNEPDFVNTGARGDPTILRKEAKTTMLVADGETSVLGGIYTRNTGLAYKKVPFLADLPVLGWFFKSRRENDDRTEILVFITPKITNKASLRCVQ